MKTICVVTGTRAEYGLLTPLIKKIDADPELILKLVATGTHLSPEFGMTINLIKNDGIAVDEQVEILLSSDSTVGTSKAMGLAMISFSEVFDRMKPDMIVVLGDRYEMLSVVTTAAVSKIPVAHLHGGETTEGAFDEAFRHSITKMSWLHFTSTEDYRKRVIQLGEAPERVFNVGAIGIENIVEMDLMGKKELEESLGIDLKEPLLLVTFHPVTLEKNTTKDQFQQLLSALDHYTDGTIIFTKANADTDGRVINKMIDEYLLLHPSNCIAYTSMGQLRYLSAMKYADVVVGNSSSGIIEAPALNIPTVNIGDRQKGRIQAPSVIDCEPEETRIREAIEVSLSSEFRNKIMRLKNPYGNGNVSTEVLRIIKNELRNPISLKKKFFDL